MTRFLMEKDSGSVDTDGRLYAVWCARQAQHLMNDQGSLRALYVAEKYASGLSTKTELEADADAGAAAAGAAAYAAAAAGAAAYAAAYVAADAAAADDAYAAAYAAVYAAAAAGAAAYAAAAAEWKIALKSAKTAQEKKLMEICAM